MIDRDSAEYKTIAGLYRDGKITAQERNKLLSALGFVGGGRKKVTFRVDGMDSEFCEGQVRAALEAVEGVDKVDTDINSKHVEVTGDFDAGDAIEAVKAAGYLCRAVDIEELGREDVIKKPSKPDAPDMPDSPDSPDDAQGLHVTINDGRTLTEFLAGLGSKITKSVQTGLKTAESALGVAGEKVKSVVDEVMTSVQNGGGTRVIKRKGKKYDISYTKLNVYVTYERRGSGKFTCKESAAYTDKIKKYCRPHMSDEAYEKTAKLLDEEFTGSYKYIFGEEVLKIDIAP